MLEGLKPVKVQVKCKIGRFLDDLDEKDRKLMQGYLDDLDFSAEALSHALKERIQSDIGSSVIRHHRKLQCCCTKLG
jgi:hypothetical protein